MFSNNEPAAVEAVWVPWPPLSRGDRNSMSLVILIGILTWCLNPSMNQRAPISFLLQLLSLKCAPCWQVPFQWDGIGLMPSSLKLSDSGQTPTELQIYQVQRMCLNEAWHVKSSAHISPESITPMIFPSPMLLSVTRFFGEWWRSPRKSQLRVVWSLWMRFGNTWTTLGNSEIRRLKNINGAWKTWVQCI